MKPGRYVLLTILSILLIGIGWNLIDSVLLLGAVLSVMGGGILGYVGSKADIHRWESWEEKK